MGCIGSGVLRARTCRGPDRDTMEAWRYNELLAERDSARNARNRAFTVCERSTCHTVRIPTGTPSRPPQIDSAGSARLEIAFVPHTRAAIDIVMNCTCRGVRASDHDGLLQALYWSGAISAVGACAPPQSIFAVPSTSQTVWRSRAVNIEFFDWPT